MFRLYDFYKFNGKRSNVRIHTKCNDVSDEVRGQIYYNEQYLNFGCNEFFLNGCELKRNAKIHPGRYVKYLEDLDRFSIQSDIGYLGDSINIECDDIMVDIELEERDNKLVFYSVLHCYSPFDEWRNSTFNEAFDNKNIITDKEFDEVIRWLYYPTIFNENKFTNKIKLKRQWRQNE
jgi:hypothetical protein